MTKKIIQDVLPSEKRTIRQISLGGKRSKKYSPEPTPEEPSTDEGSSRGGFKVKDKKIGGVNRGVWAAAVFSIAVLLFVSFSLVFAGARIEVTPKQEDVVLDAKFKAMEEAALGVLPFEVMSITQESSKIVPATGEEQVDKKASGRIVIYNNYNSSSQRLIKNTRFETPEGLIYRIDKSVVVPGRTKNSSGEYVPGSIEVEVFADTSGDEYNIDLTDFTIPGFKGDPRFDKFYARSKTAMTGGFSGIVKTVAPEELTLARESIHETLSSELLKEAHSVKPEGFVLFSGAVFIDFESLPNADVGSADTVAVREQATLYGIIFEKSKLSGHIATNTIAEYDGGEVEVLDIEDLSFSIVDKAKVDPEDVQEIDFTLKGPAKIVWVFDEERLRDDLSGKLKKSAEMVFSAYPSIEQAAIVVRPFWKREFPDNSQKIRIETKIEE